MNLYEWFTERIGRRVHLEITGVASQSWRVYMAGRDAAVLVQPSKTKMLDQLTVFYRGITRLADPTGATGAGQIVGRQWDAKTRQWIPLTFAEFRGEPESLNLEPPPDIPDHLPGDFG